MFPLKCNERMVTAVDDAEFLIQTKDHDVTTLIFFTP